jgi:replication-associated recombination protein RarA
MECLPEALRDKVYYNPSGRGLEKRIAERLDEIEKLRGHGRSD